MRPVPDGERLVKLRQLGVSDAVVRLASGKLKLSVFPLLRTPWKVYRGIEWPRRGPLFVPMWESETVVTAAREKDRGIEFFAFSVESPSSRWRLAGSEQGLLAALFDQPLNDCYDEPEESKKRRANLTVAARTLGFRHLAALDAVYAEKYPKGGEAVPHAVKRFVRSLDETSA